MRIDDDQDSIWISVDVSGTGASCHVGYKSCFYRSIPLKSKVNENIELIMSDEEKLFDPDEVYRWFMELFIDSYDWVMVPNIYGMSQFADGGLMSTKPYISSSNYIYKMSDYKKGE